MPHYNHPITNYRSTVLLTCIMQFEGYITYHLQHNHHVDVHVCSIVCIILYIIHLNNTLPRKLNTCFIKVSFRYYTIHKISMQRAMDARSTCIGVSMYVPYCQYAPILSGCGPHLINLWCFYYNNCGGSIYHHQFLIPNFG